MTKPRARLKGFISPRQVIESELPDLKIPPPDQRVRNSSLKGMFNGRLGPWLGFTEEVSSFYRNPDLQKAFQLCEEVEGDLDPMLLSTRSPHFPGDGHIQVGEERDLQGCFLQNAIARVVSVLEAIMSPDHVPAEHIEKVRKIPLASNIGVGSAKTVPEAIRNKHEPDIVFKIPGYGDGQVVRIVGEMKFPKTCVMHEVWDDDKSTEVGSKRNIFGKLYRIHF